MSRYEDEEDELAEDEYVKSELDPEPWRRRPRRGRLRSAGTGMDMDMGMGMGMDIAGARGVSSLLRMVIGGKGCCSGTTVCVWYADKG